MEASLVVSLVAVAAVGGTVAGASLGWRWHRAFLRWNRHLFCPMCGQTAVSAGPSLRDPPFDHEKELP